MNSSVTIAVLLVFIAVMMALHVRDIRNGRR
jgi:hypothetical protein